jgi:hypothetical protein
MLTRKRISVSGFSPTTSRCPHLQLRKCENLQVALAGGTVPQMDQTASKNQGLLRDQRKCGEDPDLIAVSIYVLVAIVRKRLELDASLYQILQIFSVTLFEKTPILQVFQEGISQTDLSADSNQLILFDL